MAITINIELINEFLSDARSAALDITLSSSYPTGGEDLEAAVLAKTGWTVLQSAMCISNDMTYECILVEPDNKIKMVLRTTILEVANATDLSSVNLTLLVQGY